MPHITSFQLIVALIASTMGFMFRLGLIYEKEKKLPTFLQFVFLFFFSYGVAFFVFLWQLEKTTAPTLKVIMTGLAAFLGSMIVRGLGEIQPAFFKSVFEDILRKYLNTPKNNEQLLNEENEETPRDLEQ